MTFHRPAQGDAQESAGTEQRSLSFDLTGPTGLSDSEGDRRRRRAVDCPEIIGDSEATRELVERMNALLPSTCRADAPPILVTGESGTGKELVAQYLHHCSPKRDRGPFQAFNCAGLYGDLGESRLFGHARGAFTGAVTDALGLFRAANNGVLLLDEIGELPLDAQALLLRVLETRAVQPLGETKTFPVDVQVIAATNRKLEEEIAAKHFREDLYYRLSGLQIELLPLRDARRAADIRPLLTHQLARHERALKKRTMGLTRDAQTVLLQFPWPGNVRQLSNACLRLVTHAAPGTWIDIADIRRLQPEILTTTRNADLFLDEREATYGDALRQFRRRLILDRLTLYNGSASQAAASLRISGPTFYRYWSEARRLP